MSIPTLLPPYLLQSIAERGPERPAECARKTLIRDNEIRAARAESARPSPPAAAATPGQVNRTIYDAAGSETLPGTQVRAEGEPATGDAAVDEAYDGLGDTWSLFFEAYSRDSLDNAGLPLLGTVHYGQDYANAFWDGRQMVFGDGDGQLFNRFTASLDVIGHELSHGVIEYTANLRYADQSGALNESIADVFGSLVKQRTLGQSAAEADWLIGAELFTDQVQGVALRSMSAPGTAYDDPVLGKDPQPGHMDGFVTTSDDNGGVHINSGIPNKAFHLAATALGGNAWEEAGAIWYGALTGQGLSANADFLAFAQATIAAAAARGEAQRQAVEDAWAGVGVSAGAVPSGPASDVPEVPVDEEAPVSIARSGGFAGLTQNRQFRLTELPEEDASTWRSLLGGNTLGRLGAQASSQPDRYVYRVSYADARPDVQIPETELPDAVRDLFRRTLGE